LTRAFAGDDSDCALRDAEGIGKDFDKLGVGGAIDRWRVESNQQRTAASAGDA
jgi:hypothetical protein